MICSWQEFLRHIRKYHDRKYPDVFTAFYPPLTEKEKQERREVRDCG